ncbi:MAG: peptide chain release factor N(5)-glutamine methyltransferase [Hyphomicrobiaceae bacterium]|nr:peptide chain release factor N(5)-glutamine methyltransferase [Hyphomicrobiaceae bacterium]
MPDEGAAQPLTLADALRRATAELRRAGVEGPGNDARRLISAALGLSAAQVLARPERPLRPEEAKRFGHLIARRVAREPVSRILGEREFYGRTFGISPATLDPRPDSETLIDATLKLVAGEGWQSSGLRILDVGTGSGCLLLTLLAELPGAFGVGTDVSVAALETARANAVRLGLGRSAGWLAGDLLDPVRGRFDILISNPPYIPTSRIAQVEPEVRRHDPLLALDGGLDGVSFFRRLSARVAQIVPEGWIVLETGHDQADAVATLLAAEGLRKISVQRDVAGRRRCVAVRTRN